jgi:hypothetical protein
VDAVVHLAGESVNGRWSAAQRAAIRRSRIDVTSALVGSMARAATPPSVLVSVSAVGYYGERGEESIDEQSSAGSGFLADVCVGWEAAAREAARFGARVAIARLGVVLGHGGGALPPLLRAGRLGAGGPFGSGRQWWPWVLLDDVVATLIRLVEDSSLSGPVNVVAPGASRQIEVAKAVGRALGRPAFLPAPAFGLKLLLGGFASELLVSRRVRPSVLEAAGFAFAAREIDPAIRRLLA